MRRYYLIIIVLSLFSYFVLAQNPQEYLFGLNQNDLGRSVCCTKDGGFILLGESQTTDKSVRGYYFCRISEYGTILWKRELYKQHNIEARHIVALSDGTFSIVGTCIDGAINNFDLHVLITDGNGNVISEKFVDKDGLEHGFKTYQSKDNSIYYLGTSEYKSPFTNVMVSKHNDKGEKIWTESYGGNLYEYGFALLERDNGNIIICGSEGGFFYPTGWEFRNKSSQYLILEIDTDGALISLKSWGEEGHDQLKDIIRSPNDGFYAIGSTQHNDSTSFDMVLFKLNANLEVEWKKEYGGSDWDYAESIAITTDGHLYIYGTSQSIAESNKPDQLIIKTDLEGNVIWDKKIGFQFSDYAAQLVVTSENGCVACGTISTAENKKQISFVKMDKDGVIEQSTVIDDFKNKRAIIFPNPAINKLNVQLDTSVLLPACLIIKALNGKEIFKAELLKTYSNIQISQRVGGLYIYSIMENDKSIQTGKIIINNLER